jgi:hypothetical protein
MKRYFLIFALAFAALVPARALPLLQLDASGGLYDNSTETTVATTTNFTLFAMLNGLTQNGGNYFVSAALFPAPSTVGGDYGSFVFNGQTINATADMVYGSPSQLPAHGIYPTWYKEFAFTFDPTQKFTNYNVQNVVGTHAGVTDNASGNSLYMDFIVDVSGLAAGTTLVFDLYTYGASGTGKVKFAPFSHNAGSGEGGGNLVPDGGMTLILLGTALAGLALFRRSVRM